MRLIINSTLLSFTTTSPQGADMTTIHDRQSDLEAENHTLRTEAEMHKKIVYSLTDELNEKQVEILRLKGIMSQQHNTISILHVALDMDGG